MAHQATDAPVENANWRTAMRGLADARTHPDKSLVVWQCQCDEVGPNLLDKIDSERADKKRLGLYAPVPSMSPRHPTSRRAENG